MHVVVVVIVVAIAVTRSTRSPCLTYEYTLAQREACGKVIANATSERVPRVHRLSEDPFAGSPAPTPKRFTIM